MRALRLAGVAVLIAFTANAWADDSLLAAVESGDRERALQLLSEGADALTPGPDGTTTLMWAAYNDEELTRIQGAIVVGIPPARMTEWMHMILPALSPAEREQMARHA